MEIKRGDIILVNLDPVIGSEQGKIRPAVVIQNDGGNKYSPTTIVAPITSKVYEKEYPTNVEIPIGHLGLTEASTILLNQIRTIDKRRIIKKIGELEEIFLEKLNLAIKSSLALD